MTARTHSRAAYGGQTVMLPGSGADIVNADLAALDVDADATLTLRFFESALQRSHHGFRWADDHYATFETMRVDGRLVIDGAGLGSAPSVIFTLQGDTFVGVPPPRLAVPAAVTRAASTRNRSGNCGSSRARRL